MFSQFLDTRATCFGRLLHHQCQRNLNGEVLGGVWCGVVCYGGVESVVRRRGGDQREIYGIRVRECELKHTLFMQARELKSSQEKNIYIYVITSQTGMTRIKLFSNNTTNTNSNNISDCMCAATDFNALSH